MFFNLFCVINSIMFLIGVFLSNSIPVYSAQQYITRHETIKDSASIIKMDNLNLIEKRLIETTTITNMMDPQPCPGLKLL